MLAGTMSRYPFPWVALLAMDTLTGCGSSQMSRIDRHRDIYETWPIEVRQSVLDGKVEPGMTPEMVRVAWGQPSEVVQQGGSGDEIWVYKKGGDDGSMMYPGGYPGGGYPGGGYPGGGYPGGGYPGSYPGQMGGPGVVIGTGRGGTSIGTSVGTSIGIGGGGMGGIGSGMGGVMGPGGMGTPIMTRPTPAEVREVVFRSGVVQRADSP